MSLMEQIQADLKTAMKARDTETAKTLRMVLAGLRNAQVAEGRHGELTDEEAQEVLTREAKRRREAAEAYDEAGRQDLAEQERSELSVIRRYQPEQLDESQLRALVDAAVTETGATGAADLGRVMSAVMPKVRGRADGRQVNALVRERLAE